MTEEPEAVPLRQRSVLRLELEGQQATVIVDHVYLGAGDTDPCEDCGGVVHDEGAVGLAVDDHGEMVNSVILSPEEALLVANRLTRAANLVLEGGEDAPDLEREVARFTGGEAPA